jgi:hypothetical protein
MKHHSTMSIALLLQLFVLLVSLVPIHAFTSPGLSKLTKPVTLPRAQATSLYIFGKKGDKEEVDTKENDGKKDEKPKERRNFLPFFGRPVGKEEKTAAVVAQETAVVVVQETDTPPSPPSPPQKVEKSPADVADALRAQAMRARLEAERMDAELTLSKIEKIENQLASAKAKGKEMDDLQRQMDNLQAKLRGEPPQSYAPAATAKKTTSSVSSSGDTPTPSVGSSKMPVESTAARDIMNSGDFDEIVKNLQESPDFVKKIIASMVQFDYDTAADINATEVALRVTMNKRGDYAYSSLPKPSFSQEEIQAEVQRIMDRPESAAVTDEMRELAGGDETKLAIYSLEFQYYTKSKFVTSDGEISMGEITKIAEGEDWLKGLISAVNQTSVDRSIETLFPKCTRKEDNVPTLAQVQMLMSDVLIKAKFATIGKVEPVLGGYVIRGSHKYEKGDLLIAEIDKELARSRMNDKMTVLYLPDFTLFARAEEENFDFDGFDVDAQPPVLYVTGPDIAREPQRIGLSATSAFGFATAWYLSIYPFLLNPTLGKRIEEQLSLAEGNMPFDVDFISDLSVPLFMVFIGIQFSHELAHRVVAGAYNVSKVLSLSCKEGE